MKQCWNTENGIFLKKYESGYKKSKIVKVKNNLLKHEKSLRKN